MFEQFPRRTLLGNGMRIGEVEVPDSCSTIRVREHKTEDHWVGEERVMWEAAARVGQTAGGASEQDVGIATKFHLQAFA